MPGQSGPAYFDGQPSWTAEIILGDRVLEGRQLPTAHQLGASLAALRMEDGSVVLQGIHRGPDLPISRGRAGSFPLTLRVALEEEYDHLLSLESLGWTYLWPNRDIEERWLIASRDAGQVFWRTNHEIPYGWQGLTLADWPVKAWVDSTALTIVGQSGSPSGWGSPALTELFIRTDQVSAAVKTNEGISGTHLRLVYWPRFRVRIASIDWQNPTFNGLDIGMTLEEAPV